MQNNKSAKQRHKKGWTGLLSWSLKNNKNGGYAACKSIQKTMDTQEMKEWFDFGSRFSFYQMRTQRYLYSSLQSNKEVGLVMWRMCHITVNHIGPTTSWPAVQSYRWKKKEAFALSIGPTSKNFWFYDHLKWSLLQNTSYSNGSQVFCCYWQY